MFKTTAGFVAQAAEEGADIIYHQHVNGRVMENMMSISAMEGFRHMSLEELRVADWNLDRRMSDGEDLGIDALKALSLGRAWEREGPLPIPGSSATAGPNNKSRGLIGPPPLGKGPPSHFTAKGREPQISDIAGNSNGIIPRKPKDVRPASNPLPDPGFGNNANNSPFELHSTPNVRVSSMLRAEADKSNRVKPIVIPSAPVLALKANSALPVDDAPKGFGPRGQADTSRATFVLSPVAERSHAVGEAEKEWADALVQAREAKAQLARAQAAYDQAVIAERLKFTAYCETRRRFDE
ncbi:hypothetical protein FS837_011661 [Tulasnella sp. UAMH 9824]|nr:hypothetical protein FS837_011661 [Tulasnella sp. UAMH 9824]